MKNKFHIVKRFKIFALIAVLFVVVGVANVVMLPFGVNHFNMAIDFVGGTEMEFNMHKSVTPDMKNEVSKLFQDTTKIEPSSVVEANGTHVLVRSKSIDSQKRAAVIKAMEKKYSLSDSDLYKNDDVSPSVGNDLKKAAVLSLVLSLLLMVLYITFRFEFTSGLAAIVCLLNDVFVMVSFYVILQIPLNIDFIAVTLTIIGYSINSSVIIFDRVRENLRVARKEPFEEIVERSIWQTMGRTVNTNVTVLMTIGMVFILGVQSLREFALPMIIGILAGVYSSIFLSAPLWAHFRRMFRHHA